MRDRIRPKKKYDDLLNKLKDDGIFDTRQKGMMFAASLGFRIDPSSESQNVESYGEGIPVSIFSRSVDFSFIDALAVTYKGTLQILDDKDSDFRLELFEHFAAIGLEEIKANCYEPGKDPVDGILNLIDQYSFESQNRDKLPGLDEIASNLGNIL